MLLFELDVEEEGMKNIIYFLVIIFLGMGLTGCAVTLQKELRSDQEINGRAKDRRYCWLSANAARGQRQADSFQGGIRKALCKTLDPV